MFLDLNIVISLDLIRQQQNQITKFQHKANKSLQNFPSTPTISKFMVPKLIMLMRVQEGRFFFMITHTSHGIGGFDIQTGKIKNHGSTFFSTNSTGGKLGFLNNMVGIQVDEIDVATGIAHAKTWLLE